MNTTLTETVFMARQIDVFRLNVKFQPYANIQVKEKKKIEHIKQSYAESETTTQSFKLSNEYTFYTSSCLSSSGSAIITLHECSAR